MSTMGRTSKGKGVFGKRLVALRQRLDLTQEEAAEKVGTSRQAWIAWEQGTKKPSKSHLKLIEFLEKGQL